MFCTMLFHVSFFIIIHFSLFFDRGHFFDLKVQSDFIDYSFFIFISHYSFLISHLKSSAYGRNSLLTLRLHRG